MTLTETCPDTLPSPSAPAVVVTKELDIVLFTTCDLGSGRLDELKRLLASVRAACVADGLAIRHYVLLQRAAEGVPGELCGGLGYAPCFITVPERLSLSRARNIMLRLAIEDGALGSARWAAFPDDDAWYPAGFLRHITTQFERDERLNLLTCRYGACPRPIAEQDLPALFATVPGFGELVRTVSSITLLLRADIVLATGYFDERLGAGAQINGGEDLDYGLRAYLRAGPGARMSTQPLVGHRDRIAGIRSRYFAGSLFALTRNTRSNPYLMSVLLRKLAVGVALVALGELSMRDWWRGVRAGLSAWRLPEPKVT